MNNIKQNGKNQVLPAQIKMNSVAFEKFYLDLDVDWSDEYTFVYTLVCLKSKYFNCYTSTDVAVFRDLGSASAYIEAVQDIISFQKRNKDYEKIREKMSESIKNFKYRRIL